MFDTSSFPCVTGKLGGEIGNVRPSEGAVNAGVIGAGVVTPDAGCVGSPDRTAVGASCSAHPNANDATHAKPENTNR